MKKVFETINNDCAAIRKIQNDHPCTKVYIAVLIYLLAGFMFCYGYFAGSMKNNSKKEDEEK